LVINPLQLDADGYVHVPTTPGLGVELNEEVIRKYTIDHLIVKD
jgi:L-alanine-DL-glutamate epimerase-like enolase superfamily enzyme